MKTTVGRIKAFEGGKKKEQFHCPPTRLVSKGYI
jgi:hypothetical protein